MDSLHDNFDDIPPEHLDYLRKLVERIEADPALLRGFIAAAHRRQEA